jgi:UDP-N-acetylmuramoyl-tripeptide--D-alanyl-D-alanine ligase
MMELREAARVVGGELVGADAVFSGVGTDTRTLAAGELYVALAGERFDGHDFVAAAIGRGAAGALVDRVHAGLPAGNLVRVADPLAALGTLAADWRRRLTLPLVAVVGSNGKTTVKEMIAAILRSHFGAERVLATVGNLNNAIGLPLTLLRLRAAHLAGVVEIGMNHPGETAGLAAMAAPTIAVVNNAQREHQEFMGSVTEVAHEHAALVAALPEQGGAVLNADDPHVDVWRDVARRCRASVVEFGFARDAAVRAGAATDATGGRLELVTPAGTALVALGTLGRHNAANALAAAAATLIAGVPLAAVARGLEAFRPVAGRLVVRTVVGGVAVIDDSYNANPDSVRAAVAVLASAPPPRWLVLGDMGEVGADGPAFHREAGEVARAAGIERLSTIGPLAGETAAAFGAGGRHFDAVDELVADLRARAVAGTTVLVKGSRFMRMERVVAALAGASAEGVH